MNSRRARVPDRGRGAAWVRSSQAHRCALTGPLLLALLAALVMTATLAPPASATDREREDDAAAAEAEALGLEIMVGYGGQATDSMWLPVEVLLEPRRPVAGTLEVEAAGMSIGPVSASRDIEVAAGARSVYRFLLPATDPAVRVRMSEPGRETLTVRPERPRFADGYLVGALGSVPAQAPPVRSEVTGQSGAWVPVDPAWITLSPSALEPLGSLVGTRSQLESLSGTAARNLAAAVVQGLDLVVVADRDGPVDLAALALPDGPPVTATASGPASTGGAEARVLTVDGPAWLLTAADVQDGGDGATVVAVTWGAGLGRITIAGAAPGEGPLGASSALWSPLMGPRPGGGINSDWVVERSSYQFPRLLADQESALPTIPWLAAFILSYVVLVGPVNALVLSRLRRRELAWVTVPVVAVVFTAAAFVGAVGGQPPVGVTARVAYWVDGAGAEAVVVGVRNPTEGAREVVVPGRDWALQPFAESAQGTRLSGGDAARAELHLAPLQFGGVIAGRASADPPPLDLDARAGPDGVEVTVTNRSGAALSDVTLRSASASRRIPQLAAGASETVALGSARLSPVDPWQDLFAGLGGAAGAAAPPRSLEALLRADLLDGNPGVVWAVAAAEAVAPAGVPAGAQDRGTLWVVGETPAPAEGEPVSPHGVQRTLLGSGDYQPSPLAVEGPQDAVLRFRFPAGATLDRLHADTRTAWDDVDLAVWDHQARQWRPVEEAFGGAGGDPAVLVSPLGELYLRPTGGGTLFEFSAVSVSGLPAGGSGGGS